jgi:antirestriction protein ArdC
MKAIGDDYKVIFSAMSRAQKAIDYMDSLQQAQAIAAE